MAFRMDLWKVDGDRLEEVSSSSLDFENRLEEWLESDLGIAGLEAIVIGRQVETDHGGRIDLLALDAGGNVLVLELKRGRTPRDIVAQILDYAAWVKDLSYQDLDAICMKHRSNDLSTVFSNAFETSLPETVNDDHQLVIVAPELDDSSERIVTYLAEERGLAINVAFFNLFRVDGHELVGRAWLQDPVQIEEKARSRRKAPWSGYWFANVGEGPHRSWVDFRTYGFLSAGQGEKYSKQLRKLTRESKVFAYIKGQGYVGYGVVTCEAQPIRDFTVDDGALLSLPLEAPKAGENADNLKLCEWVVGMDWKKFYSQDQAQTFRGVFANQNIVCQLRHEETLEFLKQRFGIDSSD